MAQVCFIFNLFNFPIGINSLEPEDPVPHKFIHRNCEQLSGSGRPWIFHMETWSWRDDFLRMKKYPLRIKALALTPSYCAHFYPQKV